MGCCSSSPGKSSSSNDGDEFKILLLGPAASGKSTFAKQMRVLYSGGFDASETGLYRDALIAGLLEGFQDCFMKAEDESLKIKDEASQKILQDHSPWGQLSQEEAVKIFDAAQTLCQDKTVKKLTKEYIKSGGREAFAYVLEHLERLKDPAWVPTNDDVLFARSRTTGFSSTSFKIGSRTWTVIDVGGQKVERKKWIHARGMEIDALIYFCPIGDFCVKSDDDDSKNKVQEALEVWDEVMNGEGLGGIPVILFFNKKDLLESRLKQNSVKNFVSGFDGANQYQPVIDFAKKKFLGILQEGAVSKPADVYIQETCAVDTENIRQVFDSIRDWMVKQVMEMAGVRQLFSDE